MSAEQKQYVRFTLAQRIEHVAQLVSFTILAVTGLPQKYVDAPISDVIIAALGGIETVRVIHRVAATVLMVATVYHLVMMAYKVYVRRVRPTMLPEIKDAVDAFQIFVHNIGLSKKWPQMGRYTFEEKAEYWAFVWGTLVMVATGFILWNPIATATFFPGQVIPAAKAAHGGEAVLAVLAIIVWHFYGVHLRHFNKSMWTGKLTEAELAHEHPLELAEIKAGTAQRPVDPVTLKKRQQTFYPVAGVTSAVLLVSVVWFITFEQTALATLPVPPTPAVFVPQTPTPLPPTPTPPPASALNWNAYFSTLFAAKCTNCHGQAAGLSLDDYAATIKGGANGPVIVAGAPEQSSLVTVQTAGGHPGELSAEELDRLTRWITAGAPEN